MQGKTQVLGTSEGDFHRTRLTHSMEVAQIGRGIATFLCGDPEINEEFETWLPDQSLIEAICLAHDLGHPPFGHGGEAALDFIMREMGGFEGNGQTLRMISKLEPHTEGYGLDLTRRSILGVLKYPAPYSKAAYRVTATDAKRTPANWHPPKCFHDEENDVVSWVLAPFTDKDRSLFTSFDEQIDKSGSRTHNKTTFKALDTSIMELADDIAYGVHDLEDGIALELINQKDWDREYLTDKIDLLGLSNLGEQMFSDNPCIRKQAIGDLIHTLFKHLSMHENTDFDHPLLKFNVILSSKGRVVLASLKNLTWEKMILRPQARSLEWRGQEMLRKMFEAFLSHGEQIMPAEGARARLISCEATDEFCRARAICDFISGMTDEYAARTYGRLFLPRQGNVFERI